MLSQFPAAREAVEGVNLVETSPSMRTRQDEKLAGFAQKHGWKLNWQGSIEEISVDTGKYTMILAHEFFDALPFHIIQVRILLLFGRTESHVQYLRKPSKDGKKS